MLSSLAIVCGLCICTVGAFALVSNIGKAGLVKDFNVAVPDGIKTSDGGKTVSMNGIKYQQKAGMVSILLLGHDGRQTEELNGQTDFVMVMALDTNTGQISLISIPRDTMVPIKRNYDKSDEYYDTTEMQIAAAFAYGSDFDHSAKNVCDAVSTLLYNIPINYYYVLDINGIGVMADAVGGVTLVSIENVAKSDIKEGQTYNLTGDLARQYVVERDTNVMGSAFDRLERQRQFVKEYLRTLMEVARGNPGVLLATYDALASYSTTNIGPVEFSYLATVFIEHGIDDLQFYSLDGKYVFNEETDHSEFYLDDEDVYKTILEVYYERM